MRTAAERALGVHRVLEPAGVLPQAARRLDADPAIGPDEVRISVQRLNLDAASFRQLSEARAGDGAAVRAAVLDIVAGPRQDAEPGHRLGRHAHRRRRRRRPGVAARPRGRASGWPPSSRSRSPRCAITDDLAGWDGRSEQVPCAGTAILFARLDRRGAARRPARRRRPRRAGRVRGARPRPPASSSGPAARSVVVLGAAGKSGCLSLAAARARRRHAS